MATNEQDTLARAYAMLSALQKNIEKMTLKPGNMGFRHEE